MDETQRLESPTTKPKIVKAEQAASDGQTKTYDGTIRQYSSALIVNLLAFGYGTTVGWMSPVTELLKSDHSPLGTRIDENQLSWMGSLNFLGGIISAGMWGPVAEIFGRKTAGYGVGGSLILGWVVIIFSTWTWALYVGRFILGFSSGCFVIGPLYVTEIARDSLRGTLGSFVILFMNAGVVYAYALGAVLPYRMFTLGCLAVPAVFLVCFFFLPETPSYLFSKNKKKEAEESMYWFRRGNNKLVQEELNKLQTSMKKQDSAAYMALFESKANRTATVIGAGLFFFQQFCGILVILTYVSDILTDSNSTIPAGLATFLIGVFQFISSAGSASIADKLGRKVLLIISYGSMGVALGVLGLCFIVKLPVWMPFACLSFYMLTYPLGAGPLAYVVISETLSPKIRGLATSVFVVWGTANVFLTVKIFPWLKKGLGYAGCYWFFAAWCVLGALFVLFIVPETKGIPLDKVLAELNGESVETPKEKSGKA